MPLLKRKTKTRNSGPACRPGRRARLPLQNPTKARAPAPRQGGWLPGLPAPSSRVLRSASADALCHHFGRRSPLSGAEQRTEWGHDGGQGEVKTPFGVKDEGTKRSAARGRGALPSLAEMTAGAGRKGRGSHADCRTSGTCDPVAPARRLGALPADSMGCLQSVASATTGWRQTHPRSILSAPGSLPTKGETP